MITSGWEFPRHSLGSGASNRPGSTAREGPRLSGSGSPTAERRAGGPSLTHAPIWRNRGGGRASQSLPGDKTQVRFCLPYVMKPSHIRRVTVWSLLIMVCDKSRQNQAKG